MWHCHACRLPLALEVLKRNRMCPHCSADIHACRNCVHYDESFRTHCNEPQADFVRDIAKANTCTYFEFHATPDEPTPRDSDEMNAEAERAKEAFRALFRNL